MNLMHEFVKEKKINCKIKTNYNNNIPQNEFKTKLNIEKELILKGFFKQTNDFHLNLRKL